MTRMNWAWPLRPMLALCAGLAAHAGLAACASDGASRSASRAPAGPGLLLVAGATGGTGKHVVERALAAGFRVRALVRDPENSPERIDYAGVAALAQAAKAAGVEHFVLVSSMGVTHPDHALNRVLDDILVWKAKGEQAVRDTGIAYTIVRPGGLRDGAGGTQGIRVIQGDPADVTGQIDRADVAAVLVKALGRQDAYGKTFEVIADPATSAVDWSTFFASIRPDVR